MFEYHYHTIIILSQDELVTIHAVSAIGCNNVFDMLAGMIVLTMRLLTLQFLNLNCCMCWLQDKNIHALLQKLGILEKGAGHTNEHFQSTLNGHVVSGFTVRMLLKSVFFKAIMAVAVFVEKLTDNYDNYIVYPLV